jgi:hypothetical protein
MLLVTGLLAIPTEPMVAISEANAGFFLNFKGTTQAKSQDNKPVYHSWNCSVWVPAEQLDKWQNDYLQPGNVLYIEHGSAQSLPSQDGKYNFTKIRLEHTKTKKLAVPLWYEE